ncbi:MAG: hypothetical protein LBC86_03180 [Oscillospiraceae bacterium]|jgi:hypothetical protein|nr:hypothetical protein [Oscillospiraceae bacterium]
MKKFITSLILLKIGFLLGLVATLYFTKSKLMIDIGVEKEEKEAEEEVENEQD